MLRRLLNAYYNPRRVGGGSPLSLWPISLFAVAAAAMLLLMLLGGPVLVVDAALDDDRLILLIGHDFLESVRAVSTLFVVSIRTIYR